VISMAKSSKPAHKAASKKNPVQQVKDLIAHNPKALAALLRDANVHPTKGKPVQVTRPAQVPMVTPSLEPDAGYQG